ncbi:MAG: PIN domain-containing protein [Candidatus Nanoarchaeia archaeon]|nr:PIN domain-containing protein [Candidatus Nanoarchaeia archaeon]MDD5741671.1 PIN domain-containing protein [Candidatus Nanoarchaeia archaeon]
MKIILDTNFLIYCAKNKLDYVEEIGNLINAGFELIVPLQVVEELKKLKDDKWKKVSGKDKLAIDLALQLLDVNNVKKVKVSGRSVDEGIVNLANEDKKNIVCTLDREMRHTLGRVILINKFKKLMITR